MQHEKLLKNTALVLLLAVSLVTSIKGNQKKTQWDQLNKNAVSKVKITIHLAGALRNPGVYTIPISQRLKDVITNAGGLLAQANIDKINLASYPKDGQRLYIPYKKTKKTKRPKRHKVSNKNKIISINTASTKDLVSLPHIGPKTAERIIKYRQEKGGFKTVIDLEKVKGIGSKTIKKIKKRIKI
jgi:competence protein ComEA